MHHITILGSQGSRSDRSFTTCLQITPHTLIDAGNIMHALGKKSVHINRIFFSHAHLDHIIDSAFLMDNCFANRKEPLYLYGLPETIAALKKHIFNWDIWPDFSEIHLIGRDQPSVVYVEITPNTPYAIEDGFTLTPILSNHTVACCGYIIEKEGSSLYFSGDTYLHAPLWETINTTPSIKALIIDVSFPNRFQKLAKESKHLTPSLLAQELTLLKRKEVMVYVNHLKPFHKETLLQELHEMGISEAKILHDGESINIKTGLIDRNPLPSTYNKIDKLNKIGIALSSESNSDALLESIVHEAKALTNADGGTLYLADERFLRFKVVQTDSLDITMGGTHDVITWPPLPLYFDDGEPNTKMVAATCALEDRLINIPDVYEAEGFSFEGTKQFDQGTGYRSKSMLVIPLKNHENEIIGVLQLINKLDPLTHETIAFDHEDESITLSLASQAAIAITNTSLIQGLENLLEMFLKSIIFAISKKSPYTAGHIQRMVKLTMMLAFGIEENDTLYKEKHFNTNEIKQLNFAALMHDIGKLATPEYVVDKSTKLETLFDRISLVESRIDTLKQALKASFLQDKIAFLEQRFDGNIHEREASMNETLVRLEEYRLFIQTHNKGAEFMSNEHVARIEAIAQETWTIDGKTYIILTPNEAYNLSVQRGTLTNEERDEINKHAKISVDILKKLPFPKKYKDIPQISGNHHEKINGKGYPQGLKGDEISFEARILAIADVFEALTASDRPYKKANPLSVAMKILYFMAKEDDLDREMVKFFYNSGLYMKYAKEFLPKSSIDEVSVDFSTL